MFGGGSIGNDADDQFTEEAMKTIASLIALLTLTTFAMGDCRRVAVVKAVAIVHAPYVPHHAAYGAQAHYDYGYGGHRIGYNPANENNEAFLKLFSAYKDKAEQHEALLRSMIVSAGSPLALKSALAPSPGRSAFTAACAGCHTAENKGKGNGFAWLKDGQIIDEGKNVDRVYTALRTGKMGDRDLPKLSAEQIRDMLFEIMDTGPATEAKK